MSCKKAKYICFVLSFIAAQIGMSAISPIAYSEEEITPLSVTQMGIQKLNALISDKKISPKWADGFSQVMVSQRNVKGFQEYVLQFSSKSGTPAVVTLFYNMSGKYAGSNLGI